MSKKERQGRAEQSRRARLTIPLWPDAGEALGLSRNGTYQAAARGEIPTLRFGKKIVVPMIAFERMLEGTDQRRDDPPSEAA